MSNVGSFAFFSCDWCWRFGKIKMCQDLLIGLGCNSICLNGMFFGNGVIGFLIINA
jgi:hypothetical protein